MVHFFVPGMTNENIARLLRQVAAAYQISGENRFRVIAYERAAQSIAESAVEAKNLWEEHNLASLPGVGASIADHLDELFRTGKVKHFEEVLGKLPQTMFPLLDLPGFGPKKAYKLAIELKLGAGGNPVDDLFKKAEEGKIASLEGFGEKSEQDIIESIKQFKKGQIKEKRMPLPFANQIAEDVLAYLKKSKTVLTAVTLGSLRRQVSTIGDIDIAVSTQNPEETIEWFLKYPRMTKLIEKGSTGASILTNERQIDLRVQDPQQFGSMLQYFTGSKNHNIRLREFALKKGLSLNEYGLKPTGKIKIKKSGADFNFKKNLFEFKTEDRLYNFLGLPLIPPEIREDKGEIEAALTGNLPDLIELKSIKGDLHLHSNYNLEPSHDLGSSSVGELLRTASGLKYEYIGISDHNPSISNHSEDQIKAIMKARRSKYEQIIDSLKSVRVHLFIMLEVDILPDGKLALPETAFEYVDAVIVSIHSSFSMNKVQMTERILSGLSYPKAKILAHPTGRLLGEREGYEVDWDKLFTFCQNKKKAVEINAFPKRLDLPDSLVRNAIKKGVKLVIDTDSHDASQMILMRYGVSVARRGWATDDDILNTMSYNKFSDWLMS